MNNDDRPAYYNVDLASLRLSARSRKKIKHWNLNTVGDMLEAYERLFEEMKNSPSIIDPDFKPLDEVFKALRALGYRTGE